MKKLVVCSIVLLTSITGYKAQISLYAGSSTFHGFSSSKSFTGFNFGAEIPKGNDATFYARGCYTFPRKEDQINFGTVTAKDQTTSPQFKQVDTWNNMNYFTLEGGARKYLMNDYDNGFSLYGGSNFMLVFNTVKKNYADVESGTNFDWRNDYQIDPTEIRKGNIISLSLGLQGGAKYTFPAVGTVFFDLSGQYSLFGIPNNTLAQNTRLYSPLFFTFNFGFRKDLY
ncbi:MAG: hypothetical protein RL264_1059 [Bacteroidota bacterium]|jgi:hypothetical protein